MNKFNQFGALARDTAISMASRVAIVIVFMTGLTYLHVTTSVTEQSLRSLEKYIQERGRTDSQLFQLAEDNQLSLKAEAVRRLSAQGNVDPQVRFTQYFERFPDGVFRSRLDGFDGREQAFGFIGKGVEPDATIRRRVMTFLDLSNQYGKAWHHQLQNVYFTMPENILVGYWPEAPNWAHDASPDLFMPDEEYVWIADMQHNPARETVWTGLFYDTVSGNWMVSVETPIDIGGKQIATIGHDILIDQLMARTIGDHLEGAFNIIFREDGRLIMDPRKLDEIKEKKGDYRIQDSNEKHLKSVYQLVKSMPPNETIADNAEFDEYIAVTKLSGPDWYFVSVYPKSLISQTAFSTARLILFLGVASLILELLILLTILRKKVSRPLAGLLAGVEHITAGQFDIHLDASRKDELGKLAGSFNTMSQAVLQRSQELENAREELEENILQRTRELSEETEKHRLTAHELAEKENRLRGVLETVADGIITIDDKGIIQSFNPAATSIFKYDAEEVLGQNINMLMPEPFRDRHDAQIRDFISTGRSQIVGAGRQLIGRCKDGSDVALGLTISETIIDSERIIIGVLRDITAQLGTEDSLRMEKEAAERANKAKSEFLSSMSHELRTPLNAILGFSQLLELDKRLDKEQFSNVRHIHAAGEHLLQLINEVLDLSKIEIGRIDLDNQPVPIAEVTAECFSLTQSLADMVKVQLVSISTACDGLCVYADRTRFKQVLLNLISNAIKYNIRGGRVEVGCETIADSQVRITVTDTGVGLTAEDIDSLFQPFNRLHAAGSQIDGTGIGLSISKRLVELMDGAIGVKSEPGKGTRFWLDIPLATPALLAKKIFDEQRPKPDLVTDSGNIKIVYVEDHPANRRLVQSIIDSTDKMEIYCAETGESGLQLVNSVYPDVILLDINLPDINGYEVFTRLQQQASTRKIPVIAMTANAMQAHIDKGIAAGFFAYVTKPIDITKVLKLIHDSVDGKAA